MSEDLDNKPDWPASTDGAVDWEAAFEDSTIGLLPLIAEARTPRALRECSILIIEKLFTRGNADSQEIKRFIQDLTELVPDDLAAVDLSSITDVVTGLLRQIKVHRIMKAAEKFKQQAPVAMATDGGTKTLVFTSQKGGSGKTTLCGQLAVQAELAGAGPVALIDTDPQGSLSGWWNARGNETPLFVQTTVDGLLDTLDEVRNFGIKLLFIDTQPTVTDKIRKVVQQADLVVIPARPSPHDLRAIGPTVDLAENCEKPLVFALNCATRKAKLTDEAAVALSQHGTVAPVIIHNRVDFATSMIDGRSVMELNPESKSAEEIQNLWDYLSGKLRRLDGNTGTPEAQEQHADKEPFKILRPRHSD